MNEPTPPPAHSPVDLIDLHLQHLGMTAANLSRAHASFLDTRRSILEETALLTEAHLHAMQALSHPSGSVARQNYLFDRTHLDEFAQGSVVRCFGPEFRVFEGRRIPRIPNGDFLLMSRVISIQGSRHVFTGQASIISEYDVPEDAWFLSHYPNSDLPYSILMEIAMQPCGFLSAFLGTSFLLPREDLYFRNLDGNARVVKQIDAGGKTITNQAVLASTTLSGNTIIQKFKYSLTLEGQVFFEGEAVFGYFSREAMAKQVGLDGGMDTLPDMLADISTQAWISLDPRSFATSGRQPSLQPGKSRLVSLDKIHIADDLKQNAAAIIRAEQGINPSDWYFKAHFYEDPVMPGSLAVEAVLNTLQFYASQANLGDGFTAPRFGQAIDHEISWKYRGQMIPTHRKMTLEVIVESIRNTNSGIFVMGNASVWTDHSRIYEIKHAAIEITEAK